MNIRKLVLKKFRGQMVLCDRESGQILSGQTDLRVDSPAGEQARVIVTFVLSQVDMSPDEEQSSS